MSDSPDRHGEVIRTADGGFSYHGIFKELAEIRDINRKAQERSLRGTIIGGVVGAVLTAATVYMAQKTGSPGHELESALLAGATVGELSLTGAIAINGIRAGGMANVVDGVLLPHELVAKAQHPTLDELGPDHHIGGSDPD